MILNVAFNYSSRAEIVDAVRACIRAGCAVDDLDEAHITSHLYTAGLPEPDLLIRTGGDQRISNFLLWDLAYSELYFTDAYWPEFNEVCLADAFESFRQRQRRFGRRP